MKPLIAILLFLSVCMSEAAISRVQNVSANATSVALSSTTANDVIVLWGYNATSTTNVGLPAGYTNIVLSSSVSNAARLCYKVSGGGETVTGTMTNAAAVVALVYRGLDTTAPCTTNGNAINSGATSTLGYVGFGSMTKPGLSWVAGFGGAAAATAGMNGSTAALTNRTSVTIANGLDSGAALSSIATQNLTITGTGRTLTILVELMPPGAAANTSAFFQVL